MRSVSALLLVFASFAFPSDLQLQVLQVSLPEGHEFTNPDRPILAIAPDGKEFAYVARASLFVKSVGESQPRLVPGPLAGRAMANPVYSPDGNSIAYWLSDGSVIQRVPAGGGSPVTLCEADMPYGMSWSSNGDILIGQGPKGILRVSANGGKVETIIAVKPGERAHGPQMLPDGENVLFTLAPENASWDQAQIVVASVKTKARKTILPAGRDARYLPGGYLLYSIKGQVFAVRFDSKALEAKGNPVVALDNVQSSASTGAVQFNVAPNGSLIYLSANTAPIQMGLVDLDGTRRLLGPVPDGTTAPRISNDGTHVTYAAAGDIYVSTFPDLSAVRRVISAGTFPLFSPDGRWIVFGSLGTKRSGGAEEIFLQRSDGSGEAQLLAKPARAPEHWLTPDEFSFISHRGSKENYDVWTYSLPEKGITPISVIPQTAQLSSRFSPDGHWVAYMSSNESGEWQVFLQPYPATGSVYQVTRNGGRLPMWAADAKEIYFDNGGRIYRIPVQTSPEVKFGEATATPITGYIQPLLRRNFDMTPDGKQFIMLFRPEPKVGTAANLLDELKTKSP